MNPIFKGFLK